jgi:hypothetical protein
LDFSISEDRILRGVSLIMKAEEIIEGLLIIFYRTYKSSETVREYGIQPHSLTDNSEIPFGDVKDALTAVGRMKDKGWIKILNDTGAEQIESRHMIQLTQEGIDYAAELSKLSVVRYLRDICSTIKEGIGKIFKKQ